MPLVSLSVTFTQPLKASAARAYAWATDYRSQDILLLGKEGRRKVERVADGAVMLTDVFVTPAGKVTKKKLVHLFPGHLRWTNTHVSGPNRHTQFLYEVVPAGKDRCKLIFTGHQVFTSSKPLSAREVARMERELTHEDHQMWKNLAKAMAADLGR